jgi:uncharacterized protein YndB with AHSA1/START domain
MDARARNSADAPAAERELTIRRSFDAPRALVFRVWTEPQHLAQWSCPRGFTMTENSGDLRVGGAFSACMRSPEGSDHRARDGHQQGWTSCFERLAELLATLARDAAA